MRELILKGVRQNNLKGVDLDLPLGKSIIVTGPSGSGKSSLAFETIYAEGQRRYMQSLSTYARQFLERFRSPDADKIENIPPTIALEQVNPVRNSRATVGTSTELYDYLRLLMEKVGAEFCAHCQTPMERMGHLEATDAINKNYKGQVILVSYAYKLPAKNQVLKEQLENQLRAGYHRLLFKGSLIRTEEALEKKGLAGKEIFWVVDRIQVGQKGLSSDLESRFREALQNAWTMGTDKAVLFVQKEKSFKKSKELYKGLRCAKCGEASLPKSATFFSFNSPLGACDHCKGFGNTLEVDENLVVPNVRLSIAQGAIDPFTKPSLSYWQKKMLSFCKEQRIDLDLPYDDLDKKSKELIFEGKGKFKGIRGVFKRLEKDKYKMRVRVFISRYVSPQLCEACQGTRLKPAALNVRVSHKNIAELCDLTLANLELFFKKLKLASRDKKVASDVLAQLERRLQTLNAVGLDYLTLSRLTRTLSGGEYQRILLATQLSQGLCDTMYVLDEPSIGLHPKDTAQLLGVLGKLLDQGNSLVIVEHDPEMIEWGQHVVDLGPGSGSRGGDVIFTGTQAEFIKTGGTTAKAVKEWRTQYQRTITDAEFGKGTRWMELRGAVANNLKGVNVKFPLNALVCVTGVSGSGKSTLVVDTLYPALAKIFKGKSSSIGKFKSIRGFEYIRGVELVDQSPIGKSSRSNPITFIKGYDEIRSLFAQTSEATSLGFGPGHFSFNVKGGRCDTCDGEGRVKVEMVFMEDVWIPCEECDEKRFKKQTLSVKYKGKTIYDVLNMTVDDAYEFYYSSSSLRNRLKILQEVGLGYLQLGQPGYTLSGGEAQRIKIARELTGGGSIRKPPTLFIFDEPTTGLHFNEVSKLLSVFRTLIRNGHSVLVIEHNLQVICASDYVADLGPDGGENGGSVIAMGTPKKLAQKKLAYTGKYLAEILTHK